MQYSKQLNPTDRLLWQVLWKWWFGWP